MHAWVYNQLYQSVNNIYFIAVRLKPCAPTQVNATSITRTSAQITWSSGSCSNNRNYSTAIQYFIGCNSQMLTNGCEVTLTGLSPNAQYSCAVHGIDNLGRIGGRADVNFSTCMLSKSHSKL